MPLELKGCVTLRASESNGERLEVDADDFTCEKSGMRVLGDACTRHEFLYRYEEDPRVELLLSASAIDGTLESVELAIVSRDDTHFEEERNTIEAAFIHDPDQDDEPLTPISSN